MDWSGGRLPLVMAAHLVHVLLEQRVQVLESHSRVENRPVAPGARWCLLLFGRGHLGSLCFWIRVLCLPSVWDVYVLVECPPKKKTGPPRVEREKRREKAKRQGSPQKRSTRDKGGQGGMLSVRARRVHH